MAVEKIVATRATNQERKGVTQCLLVRRETRLKHVQHINQKITKEGHIHTECTR